jgi:penicillin-binding protein 1C
MGALEYPFPVAVKTGTSQGFRDAWAVAYSGKYIVGAWIGHPENTRMRKVSGTTAAQLVKQIMLHLHPEERRGVAEHPFAPPERYTLVKICASTGTPATDQCQEVIPEYFPPGAGPAASPAVTSTLMQPDLASTASPGIPPLPTFRTFGLVPSPFSFEALLNASVTIHEPSSGAVFILDPDTPRGAQTLPLQATASPTVAQLVWYIDGKPFTSAPYPYTVRWPLQPGKHTIQASFAHADIVSEPVTILVY